MIMTGKLRLMEKKLSPVMGASALMVIPLDGDNSEVVMTYHVKGARIGIRIYYYIDWNI